MKETNEKCREFMVRDESNSLVSQWVKSSDNKPLVSQYRDYAKVTTREAIDEQDREKMAKMAKKKRGSLAAGSPVASPRGSPTGSPICSPKGSVAGSPVASPMCSPQVLSRPRDLSHLGAPKGRSGRHRRRSVVGVSS